MKVKKDNSKKAKPFPLPDKHDRWLSKKPNPVKPLMGMGALMKLMGRG